MAGVANRLARERAELLGLDEREARASELANVGASPSAMLAAALVFAAVLGFGVVLFDEVRHPRVADSYEAERATGVRVVGEIRRLPASPEHGRRIPDHSAPTYLDPGGDGHQLIYLTIATAGVNMVMLTVTGDSIAISAVVAINFAAIAADEARETLLIDTDGSTSTVTAALRIRSSGGLAAVAKGQADWQRVIRNSHLGRDRTIDVVPSGEGALPAEEIVELLRRDGSTLPKRYDAIVVVSALDQVLSGVAAALPVPDVLYCVRVGQTPIAELKRAIDAIEFSGAHTRGIVMWNAPDPILAQLRPIEDVEIETEDEAEAVS
jgi:Mrp family chromosome partitioning ATPase